MENQQDLFELSKQKERSRESALETEVKELVIPRMSELPIVHAGLLRRWLSDFYKLNGMKAPRGFWKRNKRQLLGLYQGTIKYYNIDASQILPDRY